MSFSAIAVEQREKETKILRTFLASPTNPTSPASPSQQPEKTTQQLEQTPSSSPSSLEPFPRRQQ